MGITDHPAVQACFDVGVGKFLTVKIGASLNPAGQSVTVDTHVLSLHSGASLDANPDQRQAVVHIGRITPVLAARRRPHHTIEDFTLLGLNRGM